MSASGGGAVLTSTGASFTVPTVLLISGSQITFALTVFSSNAQQAQSSPVTQVVDVSPLQLPIVSIAAIQVHHHHQSSPIIT